MGKQKDSKLVWQHAQFCKNGYGKYSNEKMSRKRRYTP